MSNGLRYELNYKGSFVNRKPPFTLNHILSYREVYDRYALPRDVRKTILRDMKTVRRYHANAKAGKFDENVRTAYFNVVREYYTAEGPDNPGERAMSRFAPFLGPKNAARVYKDLQELKNLLKTAESTPEFED